MTNPVAADSSVKIIASPQVSYALVLGLVGSYGAGAWFLATQAAALATMSERIVSVATTLNARITDGDAAVNLRISRVADDIIARTLNIEKRDEARGSSLGQLDTRMARIESKLDFLTQNVARK